MEYRSLGQTGVQVSPYALGTMNFGAMFNTCQGSWDFRRCDHRFSPPVIAGRSALIASRWARMR